MNELTFNNTNICCQNPLFGIHLYMYLKLYVLVL